MSNWNRNLDNDSRNGFAELVLHTDMVGNLVCSIYWILIGAIKKRITILSNAMINILRNILDILKIELKQANLLKN